MDEIIALLQQKAECRTPIVVRKQRAANQTESIDAAVDLVKRIAAHCDAYLEHVHAGRDDELTSIGKRIDTAIVNGDWLMISFGKNFTTTEFLRFVGRRLFTIMPDVEKRPNMELFRLWLCLDTTVQQPLVFQHVALEIDLSTLVVAAPVVAESSSSLPPFSAANSRPTSTITTRPASGVVTQNKSATGGLDEDYEKEIPIDDSTCDKEEQFEGSSTSKVGSIFHRRLEFSAGRRPMSSGSRAAEIRSLRVQSAQLARQSAVNAQNHNSIKVPSSARVIPTSGAVASTTTTTTQALPARPPSSSSNSARERSPSVIHITSEAQDAFEKTSAETLQKLHGSLLKAFVHSQPAAKRMLSSLLEYADAMSTKTATSRLDDEPTTLSSVESCAIIPVHDFKQLEVGDVLMTEDSVTLRRGTWRYLDVLLEQMPLEQYASAWSGLTRIRCFLKHPVVFSPLAVLQEKGAVITYVVYEFPQRGPLSSVLRRIPVQNVVHVAAQAAKCAAIGLQFLHDAGYVHRDISPQQLYDFDNGKLQLKITNRCRQVEPDGGVSSEGIATRWASPDALFTGRFHPEDDIWAIGVLIWEILTLCKEIPFAEYVLKDEVAAALARGDVLHCPEKFQRHPIWTKIAQPCFLSRMKRPSVAKIVEVANDILGSV